jgi:hypothetical protein
MTRRLQIAFPRIADKTTPELRTILERLDASPALRLTFYRDAVLAELLRRPA